MGYPGIETRARSSHHPFGPTSRLKLAIGPAIEFPLIRRVDHSPRGLGREYCSRAFTGGAQFRELVKPLG
jgi:hypothetical protein